MNLDQIQRTMFKAVRQPLTPGERMRKQALGGGSMKEAANSIIRPNRRLTSVERLEIYNRQYWFRIISSLGDDFEGLKALLGEKQFQKLAIAYLTDCPSQSFTLRNLGSRLEQWLHDHREHTGQLHELALDMVKLEWAEVEAFDSESRERMSIENIATAGEDPVLELQPYLQLLQLSYPIHDLLLKIRERQRDSEQVRKVSSKSLPKPRTTFVAVHRLDDSVYFKELDTEAFAILNAIRSGSTVSEAVFAAEWGGRTPEEIGPAVQSMFANWASLGWFCKKQ
jgi:hypothetical protein